jgi:D-serine deaminase-like pyridoxal phosphate-dependent protein
MITYQDYRVADPDGLETPAMLLFQDVMDHNIRSVCEMVGGGQNLIAHVKTHKSEAVARKQVEAGIDGFKCATLKELEMVLRAGARKAILSYPQVQERKIERLCNLTSSYPDAWIATIVSTPVHLDVLATVAARRKQSLRAIAYKTFESIQSPSAVLDSPQRQFDSKSRALSPRDIAK